MRTISFSLPYDVDLSMGQNSYAAEVGWDFIISKSDIIIKEITPYVTIAIIDGFVDKLDVCTSPRINTTQLSSLAFNPEKITKGQVDNRLVGLVPSLLNRVDIRVFSGTSISLVLPFCVIYDSPIDATLQLLVGANVTYEEVEHKAFR